MAEPEPAATAPRSVYEDAYPAEFRAAEDELIRARRDAAPYIDPTGQHRPRPDARVGFGLSGGGIRSATFCLGLFQALAARRLVREIDYMSTVSGGGYFGSFLTALFTRGWVRGVDDAEAVVAGRAADAAPFASRVFRHLRDNSRYLAPRGAGDLMVLAATALRNWVSVQVVLVTLALAWFVGLQLLRMGIESFARLDQAGSPASWFLACTMPFGGRLVLWSPWLLVAAVPLLVAAVPTGWAYWLVSSRRGDKRQVGINPVWGALAALVGATTGFTLTPAVNSGVRLAWAAAGIVAVLTFAWYFIAGIGSDGDEDRSSRARNRLSRWMTMALVLTAAILALGIVDSVGATVYAATTRAALGRWAAAVAASLAGAAAFARPIAMLFGGFQIDRRGRPGISFSVLTWAGAAIVLTVWLVGINVVSHAVAWNFEAPKNLPAGFAATAPPTVLGASELVVTPDAGGYVVRPWMAAPGACAPTAIVRPEAFPFVVVWTFAGLLGASWLFGQTRSFANMSSLHAFYAGRLTRAYLGASNKSRLERDRSITDVVDGDDVAASSCWRWPVIGAAAIVTIARRVEAVVRTVAWLRLDGQDGKESGSATKPWQNGGPLHVVNATVNETVDGVTGLQNQDRKGMSLAVGPAGLSLGARHHLVSRRDAGVSAFPTAERGGHRVFRTDGGAVTPEPLPLGRWAGISGAAFTAAAGSQTTVPVALLAGLFNVRLGYWWDSGMPAARWSTFARVFPVQAALLSEMLARTHGTAERLWMLSDGGHFENMGGYELIRRRLPVVVIVDAEADPDYTFDGLCDLVRKARLDFNAEITFLSEQELSGAAPIAGLVKLGLPASHEYLGSLDALRRGRWTTEKLPSRKQGHDEQYSIEVDRARLSRAHAALARVRYSDNGDTTWLLYVKATLMGDEPADVCAYHRAHQDFPQEPTSDQFFDEAQWESYRRLGEHISHRVLTPELIDYLRRNPPPRT